MMIVVVALCTFAVTFVSAQSLPGTWAQANASFQLPSNVEFEVLSRADSFGGALTYFWFTGGVANMAESQLRVYTDGALTVSCQWHQCFGIGFGDNTSPWSNVAFGKGGSIGALYSTIRIPYQSSLRLTIQTTPNNTGNSVVWFVARGVHHGSSQRYPLVVAGVPLPKRAALHVTVNQDTKLAALDELTLMQSPPGNGGLVYLVALIISSGNQNTLEGCVRKYTGPTGSFANGTAFELLGSGTEDYFSSSFYFYNVIPGATTSQPLYHASESGLTHNGGSAAAKTEMSMYKIHDRDALLFDERGVKVTWRNGDTLDANGDKCIGTHSVAGFPTNSTVTSVTWWYSF